MKDLSNRLLALYEAAESTSADIFVRETVRLLRPLFHHEGVILGIADIPPSRCPDLIVDHIFVYKRDELILEECVYIPDQNDAVRNLVLALKEPLCCDCSTLFQRERLPTIEALSRKHGLRQAMLFGTQNENARLQWIFLYRRTGDGFTRQESENLLALWPHIERCFHINRWRHLESRIRRHESRAAALINWRGFVEAADPRFCELHAIEWPSAPFGKFPAPVLDCLFAGRDYEGARIRIALCAQDDLILCKAFEKNLLSTLTPAELEVAQQFSRGLTHKDVALNLGVSENTVRSHIKHVYDKLAIHNKARLVQLMAANHLR